MQKAQLSPLVSFAFVLLCIAGAGAFSPVPKAGNNGRIAASASQSSSALNSELRPSGEGRQQLRRSDFLAMLGTVVTGSVVSGADPAHATVPLYPSSSMYLAEEIKTFDLSMPTYDSINSLKVDEKALGVEGAPEPAPKGTKTKKSAPKKESSGGGDSMLSSVLPSMNKSGPTKKSKPAKKEKAPKPEKEEAPKKAEFETMDLALPSYTKETAAKEKDFFKL
eukprot:jgi/Psemu1/322579/estExt_fgenesh1_pg.C_340018